MKDAPCKDCPRKGCGTYHTKCEAYVAWRKERDELLAQKQFIKSTEYSPKTCSPKYKFSCKRHHGNGVEN